VPLFGVFVELKNNINYILRFYLTLRLSLRFWIEIISKFQWSNSNEFISYTLLNWDISLHKHLVTK
jgi:hypothetical protein